MKRFVSIALTAVMILSALAFTACGGGGNKDYSDSKYVGTWKAIAMSMEGEIGEMEDDWFLTLNADGTGTLTGSADSEVTEFTWKPIDGGFKAKGSVKATFTDDGDNIKTTIFGADLIFEKQ